MVKLAAILAVPVAFLATVASLGVMVVDVQEGGPDGHRIVVPVPLVLAQAAVAVAPVVAEQELRIPDNDVLEHIGLARGVLEAIAAAPDGELVRVEERDEQVLVVKEGNALRVRVHGRKGEDVSVRVPLDVALNALPGDDGRISALALAGAMSMVRFTDLVDVREGDSHVRVWVW
jgi:hypothetical protein